MEPTNSLRWCPACKRATPNGPLPQLQGDQERIVSLTQQADPQAFVRDYYCLECKSIWRSAELPAAFVEELLRLREKLEEQRNLATLLRFLLACERKLHDQDDAARHILPLPTRAVA